MNIILTSWHQHVFTYFRYMILLYVKRKGVPSKSPYKKIFEKDSVMKRGYFIFPFVDSSPEYLINTLLYFILYLLHPCVFSFILFRYSGSLKTNYESGIAPLSRFCRIEFSFESYTSRECLRGTLRVVWGCDLWKVIP